jgi:hypothetical protein
MHQLRGRCRDGLECRQSFTGSELEIGYAWQPKKGISRSARGHGVDTENGVNGFTLTSPTTN